MITDLKANNKSLPIYAYCRFPRSGLANKLFVWGRAVRFCETYNAKMIAPHFSQFKIGPFFRRETDKRFYLSLFRPHPSQEISGIRRTFIMLTLRRVSEEFLEGLTKEDALHRIHQSGIKIITFNGLKDYFKSINGWNREIKRYLEAIVSPKWLHASTHSSVRGIGMHVRLGDMGGEQRHPLEWYVSALRFLRTVTGPLPISVFTDGKDEELKPILAEGGVAIVRTGSAISDLLALSRSRFLIASGCSSYSAWAAYLGQMPAMTRMGNPLSWFGLVNWHGRFIGEYDPSQPDPHLINELRQLAR